MTHIHISQSVLPLQAARKAGHVSSPLGRQFSNILYKTSLSAAIPRQVTCCNRPRATENRTNQYPAVTTTRFQLRPLQIQAQSALGSSPVAVTIMAENIDITSLIPSGGGVDTTENKLGGILSSALNGGDSADNAVEAISKLYFSRPSSDENAEDFLWTLWTFYLKVVNKVPSQDSRQQVLVSIVEGLKNRTDETVEIWGKDTKVWADLPMLGPCARDAWNLTPSFDGSEKDNATISSWISLNSFAARLLGASLTSWTEFAIWALRAGLEEEPSSSVALDGHIAVAHEWFVHAGKVLKDGVAKKEELDEREKRMLKGGKLFSGESGLNEERWAFWQQRVEELGNKSDNEETKAKAQKTLETIKNLGG